MERRALKSEIGEGGGHAPLGFAITRTLTTMSLDGDGSIDLHVSRIFFVKPITIRGHSCRV